MKIELKTLEDTEKFAQKLGHTLPKHAVIYLKGALGVGKTTFSQFFIRSLGYEGVIKSPTFTLMEPYETTSGPVCHMDLYRLASADELEFLGLRDMVGNSLMLIEWPSKGEGYIPEPFLTVEFKMNGEVREVLLTAHSQQAEKVLAEF